MFLRGFVFLSSLVQPEHLHTSTSFTSASQTEMPLCFCTSFNCSSIGGVDPVTGTSRGVFLDIRSHKQHALEDKKAIFRKAQEDADIALEAQLQEITAELSANTLADNISGPSTRLWSQETCDPNFSDIPSDSYAAPRQIPSESQRLPAVNPSSTSSPSPPTQMPRAHAPPKQAGSNRSREQEVISSLSLLESDAQKLFDEVQNRLTNLGRPSPSGPPIPFPLFSFLRKSSDFRLELDTVTLKKPAVLQLKDSISRKLQQIDSRLKSAKADWTQEQSDIRTSTTPVYGIPHDTCKHSFFLKRNFRQLRCFLFSPPLPDYPFKCGPYSSDHLLHGCCMPDCSRRQPSWLFLSIENGPIHNTANASSIWPEFNSTRRDAALQNSD